MQDAICGISMSQKKEKREQSGHVPCHAVEMKMIRPKYVEHFSTCFAILAEYLGE